MGAAVGAPSNHLAPLGRRLCSHLAARPLCKMPTAGSGLTGGQKQVGAQAGRMLEQVANMREQVANMHEKVANMREQVAKMHGQGTQMREKVTKMREQITNMH